MGGADSVPRFLTLGIACKNSGREFATSGIQRFRNRCTRNKKTLTASVRVIYFTLKNNTLCYFTLSTIALNAAGWFMAKSAKTFLLISMVFFFNNPMNCEYDIPSKRVAALIR